MKVVVVFATVRDSASVAKVQQAVDSVEVPGCATGWCKVEEMLYVPSGVQVRVEVRLYALSRRREKEMAAFLREEVEAICRKYS